MNNATLISLVFGAMSLAGSVYIVLLRFSLVTYEKNLEMRFAAIESHAKDEKIARQQELKEATARSHEFELDLTRANGSIRLLENNDQLSLVNLKEIKQELVSRIIHLEEMLRDILIEMRRENRDGEPRRSQSQPGPRE